MSPDPASWAAASASKSRQLSASRDDEQAAPDRHSGEDIRRELIRFADQRPGGSGPHPGTPSRRPAVDLSASAAHVYDAAVDDRRNDQRCGFESLEDRA